MPSPPHAPQKVRFPSGDAYCVGDLYFPARDAGREGREVSADLRPAAPVPIVIMAHGIGSERRYGLAPFAERFAARGLAVLVFDYRHLGESPGEPRRLVSPARQRADYRAALAFARSDPRLDADRVALWGTSFSGGHVLAVAAERPAGLRAVVSQIPFVSGIASTLAYPLRYHLPATALAAADALRGLLGMRPWTVPVIREKGLALLASPDSHDGYMAIIPDGAGPPEPVPARVLLEVLRYHPGRRAWRIEAPTLVVGASNDAICPIRATRRTLSKIPGARFIEVPAGHFDVYRGSIFEKVVSAEADFLEDRLSPG